MNKCQTILRSAAAHQLERDAGAERADRARCRVGGFGDRKLPTARSSSRQKGRALSRPALLGRLLSDLIIVRFGPPCGLKSDISQGPRMGWTGRAPAPNGSQSAPGAWEE